MNLTELQKADPDIWKEIDMWMERIITLPETDMGQWIIQGCLQRAIEKRGLIWAVFLPGDEPMPYMANIYEIGPGYDGDH